MTDSPDGAQDVEIYPATKEWEPKLIEFGVEDGIARITLNRPPANVFSVDLLTDIAGALETLEFRDDVKLIVIAARGRYFSAGFELADQVEDRGYLMVEALRRTFELLLKLDKPSLSVVAGPGLGPGSLLAGACDICLAGSGSQVCPSRDPGGHLWHGDGGSPAAAGRAKEGLRLDARGARDQRR